MVAGGLSVGVAVVAMRRHVAASHVDLRSPADGVGQFSDWPGYLTIRWEDTGGVPLPDEIERAVLEMDELLAPLELEMASLAALWLIENAGRGWLDIEWVAEQVEEFLPGRVRHALAGLINNGHVRTRLDEGVLWISSTPRGQQAVVRAFCRLRGHEAVLARATGSSVDDVAAVLTAHCAL